MACSRRRPPGRGGGSVGKAISSLPCLTEGERQRHLGIFSAMASSAERDNSCRRAPPAAASGTKYRQKKRLGKSRIDKAGRIGGMGVYHRPRRRA